MLTTLPVIGKKAIDFNANYSPHRSKVAELIVIRIVAMMGLEDAGITERVCFR